MYKLKISPEAKNDLIEIKNYISVELCNQQAAVKMVSKITKKLRDLIEYPESGVRLPSIEDIRTGYRVIVCANYLIFYRCEDQTVFVVRILYGRRDYIRILFNQSEIEAE